MLAGCGNSNMAGDMVKDGFKDVVCGDISRVAIKQLQYRYKNIPEITFFQGTMVDTDLPEKSFNAVIVRFL